MDEIKALYVEAAREVFGWELLPMRRVPYDRVEVDCMRLTPRDHGSAHGRIRTCDTWLRRPVLYPLSYVGVKSDGRLTRLTAGAGEGHYTRSGRLGDLTYEVGHALLRVGHDQGIEVPRQDRAERTRPWPRL